jgi:hypothetical protein
MTICKSNTFSGVDNLNWNQPNWSNRVTFHADEYFEPYGGTAGRQNLVFVVANATGQGKGLHPIGSGWAFADLAASDSWVVKLDNFVGVLDYVTGKIATPLVQGTVGAGLTDAWRQKQNSVTAPTQLVHIEAGMEVGQLTDDLANLGLGLPTLGGANGQSVAGAFSTSTHGGDWDQPPLADCVRAIHLVTDGGRELWIERASNPITDDARLAPVLPCPGTTIVRSDEIFDAALVGFGRLGVIYSLVLEVRRAFRVVEVATMPNRASVFQALTAGMSSPNLFDPLFTLLAQTLPPSQLSEFNQIKLASTTPYFFQLVFNSLDPNDLWVQRRWITSDATDLNLPDVTPGCLVYLANAGLNISWLGGSSAAASVVRGVMSNALGSAITQGRRGPHQIITSGTRAMSHNWNYKADSIEVIFPATNSGYITFLNTIQSAGPNYQQAGYISVRPSRAGRATLSMHNVASAHAISIEVASIKGQRDNETWMQFVHQTAVGLGGRPHWGQINTLDDHQMMNLYGQARRNWQTALNRVSGASTTFSNAFTRQRGLEPADFSRKVAAVSQGIDELLVVRIANTGTEGVPVQADHWSPTSGGWSGWKALPSAAGSPESSFGSAAVDGSAYLFWTGPDGWVYFISRAPGGVWSIWWIVGRSNEPEFGGVPNGAINAASCQPGMLHAFYAGRHGDIIACRADTAGGTTWPESIRGLLGGRTAPGGHVTACSRRQGQLDIFTVGTDGNVYTAAWNAAQGWKGWWPIAGVTAKPGTYVAAVTRSLDQIDIFVADQTGRIMSAAWNPTQTGWKGWWQIQAGVTTSGFVTAVSRSANLLDLFTTDASHQVQTAAWNPTAGWGGWWPVSNAKAQSIVWPVSRSANKLDVFFVDPTGVTQTAAWEPGKTWGGPWALP